MKNWGTRIMILYLGFVALIATLVTLSMRQQTDLVAKDYYAREIAYQDHLDRVNRSHALEGRMTWTMENGKMILEFPPGMDGKISGTVQLYCASDAGKDLHAAFSTNNRQAVVDIAKAKAGTYQLQVNWEAGSLTYYDEAKIRLP